MAIMVYFLIQGLFANITGLGGVGENAFYDHSVGIYVIGVRVLVLLVCIFVGDTLKPTIVISACALLWATGLLLVSLPQHDLTHFFGALTLEFGCYALQVLSLVIAVQYSRRDKSRANQITLAMIALIFSNHITRLLSVSLSLDLGFEINAIAVVSLICLWCVVCTVLFHFLSVYRISGLLSMEPSCITPPAFTSAIARNSLIERELRFGSRFQYLCEDKNLTEREREVLFEAVHGYTIDHIAKKLSLSSETVKTYLGRAYARIGTNSKQGVLKMMDSSDATEFPK
jgi:DNA-binding CsgD family transcriptional regulator